MSRWLGWWCWLSQFDCRQLPQIHVPSVVKMAFYSQRHRADGGKRVHGGLLVEPCICLVNVAYLKLYDLSSMSDYWLSGEIVDLDRFNSRWFFNDVRFFGAFYAIANSALKCTRFLCLDPPLNNVVGISWLDLSSVMDGLQAIDEGQSNKVQVRRYPKNTSRKKWVHPKFLTLPDNI